MAEQGWTKIPNAFIARLPQFTPVAVKLYVALAMRRDNKAATCYPSFRAIRADTGLSYEAISRGLAELTTKGVIAVTENGGQTGRGGTTNLYTFSDSDPTPKRYETGSASTTEALRNNDRSASEIDRSASESPPKALRPAEQNYTQELDSVTRPKKEPAGAGAPPAGLIELISAWNRLGPEIVRPGNGARLDPPAKQALDGWSRAMKDPEQRAALNDIPAVLAAIRNARFCHNQGWFDLPWLFGRNKNRQFNICRLMAGAYDGEPNGSKRNGYAKPDRTPGPGQKYIPGTELGTF